LIEQLSGRIGKQIAARQFCLVTLSAPRQYARDPHVGSMFE
jgi:hypothetical protein